MSKVTVEVVLPHKGKAKGETYGVTLVEAKALEAIGLAKRVAAAKKAPKSK
ncbi:hypothetical protein IB238_09080 [Rhizobium sp. ARZ01]|uniref:hypothetical protein n=1 Tax=Rhizobium sp. ARZ01 TaxID=2769313 RepID=UPI0017870CDB|nr:hypothetical protein [Rhizobium sp. ARZ01]MBD9372773.1 hypothetical protein [Rhizobium sp. ARZ01]